MKDFFLKACAQNMGARYTRQNMVSGDCHCFRRTLSGKWRVWTFLVIRHIRTESSLRRKTTTPAYSRLPKSNLQFPLFPHSYPQPPGLATIPSPESF